MSHYVTQKWVPQWKNNIDTYCARVKEKALSSPSLIQLLDKFAAKLKDVPLPEGCREIKIADKSGNFIANLLKRLHK